MLRATVERTLRPHLPPPELGAGDGGEGQGGRSGDGGRGGTRPEPGRESETVHAFFGLTLSREFEPPKPHPAALLHVAARWGVSPEDLVMAGDAADDMLCARAAGAAAVLVGSEASLGAEEFARARPLADAVVADLRGLRELLDELLGC